MSGEGGVSRYQSYSSHQHVFCMHNSVRKMHHNFPHDMLRCLWVCLVTCVLCPIAVGCVVVCACHHSVNCLSCGPLGLSTSHLGHLEQREVVVAFRQPAWLVPHPDRCTEQC